MTPTLLASEAPPPRCATPTRSTTPRRRGTTRGLGYGPGLRGREEKGGGPPNRMFFIKTPKPLLSLADTRESDKKLVAGRSVWL